jgi:glycosyltransferase involved in cell wall biosynthesis
VPSLEEGGRMATLEAMAAGRAVLASNLPGLADLVADGETGLLVPPDDKLALARAARVLLEDEPRRRRMGEVARERARTHFPLSETTRALQEVYRGGS